MDTKPTAPSFFDLERALIAANALPSGANHALRAERQHDIRLHASHPPVTTVKNYVLETPRDGVIAASLVQRGNEASIVAVKLGPEVRDLTYDSPPFTLTLDQLTKLAAQAQKADTVAPQAAVERSQPYGASRLHTNSFN